MCNRGNVFQNAINLVKLSWAKSEVTKSALYYSSVDQLMKQKYLAKVMGKFRKGYRSIMEVH